MYFQRAFHVYMLLIFIRHFCSKLVFYKLTGSLVTKLWLLAFKPFQDFNGLKWIYANFFNNLFEVKYKTIFNPLPPCSFLEGFKILWVCWYVSSVLRLKFGNSKFCSNGGLWTFRNWRILSICMCMFIFLFLPPQRLNTILD